MIELLVVISIIVLLIALLLPALSSARAAGKATQCKAKLNQIGLALAMYADDNRSYYPDYWYGGQPRVPPGGERWTRSLGPYVHLERDWTLWGELPHAYICPTAVDDATILKWTQGPYRWWETSYGMNAKINQQLRESIRQPAIKFAVADKHTYVIFHYGWGASYPPLFRHQGATNMLFLDGHVAALKEEQTRETGNWYLP